MGSSANNQHEDVDFICSDFTDKVAATIDYRNKNHYVWGFKWPAMRSWFKDAFQHFQNPHFIYCYRNLYKKSKRNPSTDILAEHLLEGAFWGEFFKEFQPAVTVVDFDMSTEELVNTLITALDLHATDTQIKSALAFNNKDIGYQIINQVVRYS